MVKLLPSERRLRKRLINRRYYQANRERIIAAVIAYQKKHPLTLEQRSYKLALHRRYYQTHREEYRRYYQNNRKTHDEYTRQYLATHRDENKKYQMKWKYNLNPEEYDLLLQRQKGLCGICKQKFVKICVDHDHKTGKVRGLLCINCNSALGLLHDNPDIARQASEYLDRTLE